MIFQVKRVQPLHREFKAENMRLLELETADLIGTSIHHLYERTDDEMLRLLTLTRIVKIHEDTEDPCFFMMKMERQRKDSKKNGSTIWNHYLSNYLNNWVQIVSLDLDADVGNEDEEDGSI